MKEIQNIQYIVDYIENSYNAENEFIDFYKQWKEQHPKKYLTKEEQNVLKKAFAFWQTETVKIINYYINNCNNLETNVEKDEFEKLQTLCAGIINKANMDLKTNKIKNIDRLFVVFSDIRSPFHPKKAEVLCTILKNILFLDSISLATSSFTMVIASSYVV